jgi:hypothetical protein
MVEELAYDLKIEGLNLAAAGAKRKNEQTQLYNAWSGSVAQW